MPLAKGEYPLGPDCGHVHLLTTREGVAKKVGHDLVIGFPRWSGRLVLDSDDPADASVDVEIDLRSLAVLDGTGGVAALSADDKADITATALKLLDVERSPTAAFSAARIDPAGQESGTIEGSLTLHGVTGPLRLDVTQSEGSSWRATGRVLQSGFGIKPYRAFFGALRLADEIGVDVALDLDENSRSAAPGR